MNTSKRTKATLIQIPSAITYENKDDSNSIIEVHKNEEKTLKHERISKRSAAKLIQIPSTITNENKVTTKDKRKEKTCQNVVIMKEEPKLDNNLRLLTEKDIQAMTSRVLKKKKKKSRKTHQRPILNLPPLLQLRHVEIL